MARFAKYLLVLWFVLMCFGSCRRARVIPKKDFAAIYAEMFIADQWIKDNPSARGKADTTLVYDRIFKKYGYTFEDYDKSVNYYLYDPSKYAKILDASADILEAKLKELRVKEEEIERYKRIHKVLTPYHPVDFWPRPEADSHYYYSGPLDSLTLDSLMRASLLKDSLRRDSLLRDSLRLDSLRLDSLRLDSVRRDSLRRFEKRSPSRRQSSDKLFPNASRRNRVRTNSQS